MGKRGPEKQFGQRLVVRVTDNEMSELDAQRGDLPRSDAMREALRDWCRKKRRAKK